MPRSARIELLRAAFTNWRAPAYFGSLVYRTRRLSPRLFQRLMDVRLYLRTREGPSLTARMRDVNGPAEVFGAGEYSIESIDWSQASYILDAGAHVGGFALWASVRAAPAARIVCFEPNPDVRQLLEINVAAAELGGRITVQPYALAASRGKRRLGRGDDSSASAFAQATSAADPQVETIGLEEALSLTGFPRVDVMKVDIEGAEYETFAAIAPDSLAHVGACIIECHPLPDARTESIAGLLRSCGYAVTERSKPLGLELLVGIRTRVPSTV